MNRLAGPITLALVAASCQARESPPATAVDYDVGTHVVVLGTGTPNADPERWGPAVAVVVDGQAYLVDAGPGVVRRAAAAVAKGVAALQADRLTRLFVTHLHHDHTLGVPDLIFTSWTLEREVPLELYGPPGIASMVDHLQAAYAEDVRQRLDGLEPANATGFAVNVHEIAAAGVVYQDERVRVTAFPVIHGSWEYAFGYRFESADRSVVISGDATKSETIVEYCNGCDVLVHEVYAQAGFDGRTADWQAYHRGAHTSSFDLGDLASRARPRLLVLYHQLLWGATEAQLLAEISSRWSGPTVSAKDLDIF